MGTDTQAPSLRVQAIVWQPTADVLTTPIEFLDNAARIARQANTVSRVEVVYGCVVPLPAEQQDTLRRRFGALDLLFVQVEDTR